MSVRQSLLAILDQGPCYGYQLKAEFDRRTGGTWPLNVGQIYNTLDRLERDGFVVKGEPGREGHVYYEITGPGRGEVESWLSRPVARSSAARDELAIKLALAATLPGVDLESLIADQLTASRGRLESLARSRPGDPALDPTDAAGDLAGVIVLDSLLLHAEAEVRWLARVAERLSTGLPADRSLPLRTSPPRRGRPARPAVA